MATTATTDQVESVQATLRVVQALSDPQAAAIAAQMERAVMVEVALRKLVGAVEFYMMLVGRPMTIHQRVWDEMRAALAEGLKRVRG